MIKIKLDVLPPTWNHMYSIGKRRMFLTKEAKAFKFYATYEISKYKKIFKTADWYSYIITSFVNANRRDIDAHTKIVQDCLAKGLGINDNRILFGLNHKVIDKKVTPHIEIILGSALEMRRVISDYVHLV